MKKYLAFVALIFILSSFSFAHEDEVAGFDIDLSPQTAFQGDEVAIEARIEKEEMPAAGLDVSFVVDRHEIGLSERIETKERETGSYVAKYAFRNAGEHEIHVEFLHDGQEIRKTVDVSVQGRSAEMEQYFQAAAILFMLLPAYYAFHTRRFRRASIFALVLLAATGIIYSVYALYASGAAQRGVVVCTDAACYWTAHIHAEVNIEVCDEEYRFPVEKGRLDGPHTHEEKNLIHFHDRLMFDPATKEIQDPKPLTLGAFFDAMETNLSETSVLDSMNGNLCKGQPGSVKMFVNGKPSSDFRDYIWKDGDRIRIVFDERPAEAVAKEEQKATAELTPQLTLPIIIGFALIDSINPCVIGVLLLLITMLLKSRKKRAVIVNGSVYTLGVYATYLIGGLTLLSVFNAVREVQALSQMFYVVIGGFVLLAAFLEIKDYFWYGRGFSLAIPKRLVGVVEGGAKGAHTSLISAFLFGAIVTLIELPCTGAPYLAIITMMSQSGVQFYSALSLLLLYNLIFVLPLIIIIYMAYKGVGYKKMEFWRREHKGKMRLAVGIMLLGISTWIITTVMDWLLPYLAGGSILAVALMYTLWKSGQHRHDNHNNRGRRKKYRR